MKLLVVPAIFLALTFLSAIVMFWAFASCDEDDEYNKWD
jgi:hypothetical protein